MTRRVVRDRLTRFWSEVGPPGVSDPTKKGGEDCRRCGGDGFPLPDDDTEYCPRCHGSGREPDRVRP